MTLRRVEREGSGGFEEIAFADLKAGDRFKLYDDCVNPFETGDAVYTAQTDAAYAPGSTAPETLFVKIQDREPHPSRVIDSLGPCDNRDGFVM